MTTRQNSQYQLNHFSSWPMLLQHYGHKVALVRDGDDAINEADMLLRARVRSGDYFTTLATELEKLADSLAASKRPESVELERIAAELLTLNRQYVIDEK